ncbi:phosphotransferase family protein [Arsenicicoccus dermatophilus]|uniref:phosphotransferase family protein n=1 Tax=Arsenicicoccus dermatophilus TaxID=1076331 RepID=UPI0039170693
MDAPEGLDLVALRRHLERERPGLLSGELSARLIAGGRSNLTYAVTDAAGTTVVVRRPPLGHVLATAHDMTREHRVMSALAATDVPVPATYLCCADPGVIGAPFYVMERAEGTPYRRAAELEDLGPQRTRAISERLVDVLAELHSVDPAGVGLADFGRPEGFLPRQVRRWSTQLEHSRSRDLAGVEELHDRLAAAVPVEQRPAIVHGDYRLDNLLVAPGASASPAAGPDAAGHPHEPDRVTAVLDWEMATLGDPLTDLGLLVVYQQLADLDVSSALVPDVSRAPGHLTTREQLDRYAVASGRDVSDLGFYVALACYKLAVILEGIHYRYVRGKTLGEGFAEIGGHVEPLIDGGLRALKEQG